MSDESRWTIELEEEIDEGRLGSYQLWIGGGVIEVVAIAPNRIEYFARGGELGRKEIGLALDWIQETIERIRNPI